MFELPASDLFLSSADQFANKVMVIVLARPPVSTAKTPLPALTAAKSGHHLRASTRPATPHP